tara:strand:+ start:2077 stop:2214 length:138 start_codon:yes stop_codon:yes gene_type:complete
MGDFNQLSSGTVSHSHSSPSSDGHSLNETTLMLGMPLNSWILAMS